VNLPVVPLLAVNFEWLEGLFGALVVLLWIGAQIRAVFRKVAAPREPVVVRRPVQPAAPAGDDDPRIEIGRQIEAFLRDAAGRGQSPSDPRRQLEAPADQRRRVATAPPRPARPRKTTAAVRPQPAAPAAPLAPRLPDGGRPMGGLGGHTGDIARHVRAAFAPQVESGAVPAARPASPLATEIAALLRGPEALRHLVLAREILDRPEHRW
jgi:hypothetical protein